MFGARVKKKQYEVCASNQCSDTCFCTKRKLYSAKRRTILVTQGEHLTSTKIP